MVGAMLVRHEPTGASTVRHELAADLEDRGVAPSRIHDATLVTSELIGNAVQHGGLEDGDALDVFWTIGADNVLVTVCDASTALPHVRRAQRDEQSGRGMTIVETLASEWGTARTERGKCVWAKIPLG